MKIEFTSIETEPLLYFLLHSGVFVIIIATLFFVLGTLMGMAIWGRYKKQLELAREETSAQYEEIAVLKRKLFEQSMKALPAGQARNGQTTTHSLPSLSASPTTASSPSSIPLLTEIIPSSEQPLFQSNVADKPPTEDKEKPPTVAEMVTSPRQEAPVSENPSVKVLSEPAILPIRRPTTTLRRPTIRSKSRSSESNHTDPAPAGGAFADDHLSAVDGGGESSSVAEGGVRSDTPLPVEEGSVKTLLSIRKGSKHTQPIQAAPEPVKPRFSQPDQSSPLGPVYTNSPSDADDLKRIKGISSVLEKRLHEMGIYTWRQIADWDEAHVRECSSRLAFKDRISREKWQEQARTLHQTLLS